MEKIDKRTQLCSEIIMQAKIHLKTCIMVLAVMCSIISLTSCDKTEIKGSISISGKVEVSPSVAKVGDEVTFSIFGIEYLGNSSTSINGKELLKSIVYYIDGNEIDESSDKSSKYTFKYKVTGLIVGTHTVTARCKSNFKDVEIEESITSSTLTIEE